ncbi:unnamed protein product [Angiostrongylus costaricensis]|uniref:Ovule protein n=1 Tax=Angiostrongylus costaricensis TaxID=334426 RepID=A0A0R3PI57_ANGCS|nr:unnamed protein product [Angiostrongylus costaricensis]
MSESVEHGTGEQRDYMETMAVDVRVEPKGIQGSDVMTTLDMDDFFDEGKRGRDEVRGCSDGNHPPMEDKVTNGSEIKEASHGGEENKSQTSQSSMNDNKERTKRVLRKRKSPHGDRSTPVITKMRPRRSARLMEKRLRKVNH